MKKALANAALTALVFLMISEAGAVEFQSPRTQALGGAGRAGPWLTDSIYLNPSFGSYAPLYALTGAYTSYEGGRNYNVSVQDSRAEFLQAGAGFTKREHNSVVSLGASRAFGRTFGVGLGSKILIDTPSDKMTSDFILSTSYIALPWAYASFVVDNLVQGSEQKARNLYRTAYLGLKLIPAKKVEIFVDPFVSPDYPGAKKAGYNAGIELGVMDDFFLRLGKYQDAEIPQLNGRGSGFSYGLGWLGPKISLDYAVQRTLTTHSGGGMNTAHSGSVSIFF
jgi:hypothetical protein